MSHEQVLKDLRLLHDRGRFFVSPVEFFARFIENIKPSVRRLYRRGLRALEAGRYSSASKTLSRVLSIQPRHIMARAALAKAREAMGMFAESAREYDRVSNYDYERYTRNLLIYDHIEMVRRANMSVYAEGVRMLRKAVRHMMHTGKRNVLIRIIRALKDPFAVPDGAANRPCQAASTAANGQQNGTHGDFLSTEEQRKFAALPEITEEELASIDWDSLLNGL